MIGKINWKKKNGNTMETNDLDATIKYMESSGAVRVDEKRKPTKEKTDALVNKVTKVNPVK